jgi:hypothetical protein
MKGSRQVDTEREASEVTYLVLDIDSDHAEATVSDRLLRNPDVNAVVVDLETKGVTVHGQGLDVAALRTLIENAGYRAA